MNLKFIGVGEAFDARLGTSCSLIERAEGNILIDCGYACLGKLFEEDINKIHYLYLTHFHGDHSFGIPALLFRMFQEGRTRPLIIVSQKGSQDFIKSTCERAFPKMLELLTFSLEFIETEQRATFDGFKMEFAQTDHTLKNMAVRFDFPEVSVAFSGDGALTEDSRGLYEAANWLVHEAFCASKNVWGHESAENVLESTEEGQGIFFVHISRDERSKIVQGFSDVKHLSIPNPGEIFCLQSLS